MKTRPPLNRMFKFLLGVNLIVVIFAACNLDEPILKENQQIEISRISDTIAHEFIQYYKDSEPGAENFRSVWLTKEVLDYIKQNVDSLDGLRIYMAKYKAGVGRIGESGDERIDKLTMILAPTKADKSNQTISNDQAYFDYADLCPPLKCGY